MKILVEMKSFWAVKAEEFCQFTVYRSVTFWTIALRPFILIIILSVCVLFLSCGFELWDWIHRIEGLIFLHKSLYLINHILCSLALDIFFIVVFQYFVDTLLFFFPLLHDELFLFKKLRWFFVLRREVVALLKWYHLLRIDLKLEVFVFVEVGLSKGLRIAHSFLYSIMINRRFFFKHATIHGQVFVVER